MRDHLCPVLGAIRRQRIEPLGHLPVSLRTNDSRHLAVGPVADEGVDEDVLLRTGDGRPVVAPHELLALERVEPIVQELRVGARQRSERVGPEDLAQHRRLLEQAFLVVGQRVDPRRDHSLERRGHLRADAVPVRQHARVLLGVQRVAARPLEQGGLLLGREHAAFEQDREQAGRVRLGERRERHAERVALPAAPPGPALEQLGSRGADDEQRHACEPVGERVDEVEEAVVRPLEVLEDEHRRAPLAERFEEAPPGGERFRPLSLPGVGVAAEPHERPKMPLHPLCFALRDEIADRCRQLCVRLGSSVRLEDSRLRLHDLAERPERDPLPVGQRTALSPEDQLGILVDDPPQLVDEAALTDARHADEGDELWLSLGSSARERVGHEIELALAADERPTALLEDVDAEARPRRDRDPGGERLRLALGRDGLDLAVLDRPRRQRAAWDR